MLQSKVFFFLLLLLFPPPTHPPPPGLGGGGEWGRAPHLLGKLLHLQKPFSLKGTMVLELCFIWFYLIVERQENGCPCMLKLLETGGWMSLYIETTWLVLGKFSFLGIFRWMKFHSLLSLGRVRHYVLIN